MKRIRKIEILGVPHKIKYKEMTNGEGGYYSPSEKEIVIDKETVDPDEYLEDLLHECLHGVLDLTGVSQDISLPQEHCIIDSTITFLRKNFDIKLKK